MKVIDLNIGESVNIGDDVICTVVAKTGRVVRLAFKADSSIPIERQRSKTAANSPMFGIGMPQPKEAS